MPDLYLENIAPQPVAGLDEAGRGPLAGPVVAAAVILPSNINTQGIEDSKRLSRYHREKVFERLWNTAIIGVGEASVGEIDDLNILQASMLAMRRAVEALETLPKYALVDGNRLPDLPCPGEAIVKGDTLSLSIAAASIIAKETRDRYMRHLAKTYPHYGWERNVGYGTPGHVKALKKFGATPHHRRSFRPVRETVDKICNSLIQK